MVIKLLFFLQMTFIYHQVNHIIYSVRVYFVSGKLLVVTEFCPGGNLRNFLRSSRIDYQNLTSISNERQLLKIALDVVSGMVHLSHHKVSRCKMVRQMVKKHSSSRIFMIYQWF